MYTKCHTLQIANLITLPFNASNSINVQMQVYIYMCTVARSVCKIMYYAKTH